MPARKLKSNTPSVVAGKIGSNDCGIAGHSSRRSNEALCPWYCCSPAAGLLAIARMPDRIAAEHETRCEQEKAEKHAADFRMMQNLRSKFKDRRHHLFNEDSS